MVAERLFLIDFVAIKLLIATLLVSRENARFKTLPRGLHPAEPGVETTHGEGESFYSLLEITPLQIVVSGPSVAFDSVKMLSSVGLVLEFDL